MATDFRQIRDSSNRLLATLRTTGNGQEEIRDTANRLLATYDPTVNETRDSRNKLVARGHALASFVKLS